MFFFLQFLVDILPLGSGFVDPHIFADPDSGSQNLADPTDPDPDPKHCGVVYNVMLCPTSQSNYEDKND